MDTDEQSHSQPRKHKMHSLHTRPSGIQHTTCTTIRQHHTTHEHQPTNTRTDPRRQTHITIHKGTPPTTRITNMTKITTHHTPTTLHYSITQETTPRRQKQTTYNNTDYTTYIDTNPNTIDDAKIKTNMKHIHTTIVNTYLDNRQYNKVTNTIPLTVHRSETTLSRASRRTLPNSEQTNAHYYQHLDI